MPRKRVLAVDDEPELLNVFRERLQGRYDIDTAVCASDAVQTLERNRPDVLLLDINMPGVDGLTLLSFVRKTHAKLPVIVITGNTDHRVSQKCLEQGAFAFAPKPLHLDYLDHLVASAVGQ
jgi:DNA-binding NtrC family response regulator